LADTLHQALHTYAEQGVSVPADTGAVVFDFMLERFRAWYQSDGVTADVFQSVMELKPVSPMDFALRVNAVDQFSRLPESASLAAANKRVSNILQKQPSGKGAVDVALLVEPAEKALAQSIDNMAAQVEPLFAARDYAKGLAQLAAMKTTIDQFFDEVLVMADDVALRDNRLALLGRLRSLFLQVADISCLHHTA
jgi:glycyl-tRNA synthetase beta chain